MKDRRRKAWVTTAEAADMLGRDKPRLDRLIDGGLVTTTRIGGITYVFLRDLHPYIAEEGGASAASP